MVRLYRSSRQTGLNCQLRDQCRSNSNLQMRKWSVIGPFKTSKPSSWTLRMKLKCNFAAAFNEHWKCCNTKHFISDVDTIFPCMSYRKVNIYISMGQWFLFYWYQHDESDSYLHDKLNMQTLKIIRYKKH